MKRMLMVIVCLFTFFTLAFQAAAEDHRRGRGDFEGRHGYRERPYDHRRHYEHYDHRGYRYDYRGHWRSWDDWDRYYRDHPYLHRHGGYYREDGHLLFRYCDPNTGACYFFSIGR